jgi:hypothetical protein
MQSIPVTTRLKSLAKELAVGKQTSLETSPRATASKTIIEETKSTPDITKKVKGDKVEKLLLPKDFEGGAKNPEYIKKKAALDKAIAAGADARYKDREIIVEKGKKGEQKKKRITTDLYRKNEQDVLTNFETRQNLRKGKFTNRRVKRAQNNVDDVQRKLNELKKNNITSGKKFDRLTSKLTMRQENLKNAKSVKDNASRSIDSGRRTTASAGSKVRQEDVVMTQGDFKTKQEQLENAVTREANRTSSADKAVNPFDSIDISGSGDFSPNYTPFTGNLSGAIDKARGLGERNTVKSVAAKKKSGFQMKGYGKR